VNNLYTKLGSYFELYFLTVEVDNLDANLGGYFEISLLMKKWIIYIQIYGMILNYFL
jgi:hypothetical protein